VVRGAIGVRNNRHKGQGRNHPSKKHPSKDKKEAK
jgi:hypothetical protein